MLVCQIPDSIVVWFAKKLMDGFLILAQNAPFAIPTAKHVLAVVKINAVPALAMILPLEQPV